MDELYGGGKRDEADGATDGEADSDKADECEARWRGFAMTTKTSSRQDLRLDVTGPVAQRSREKEASVAGVRACELVVSGRQVGWWRAPQGSEHEMDKDDELSDKTRTKRERSLPRWSSCRKRFAIRETVQSSTACPLG